MRRSLIVLCIAAAALSCKKKEDASAAQAPPTATTAPASASASPPASTDAAAAAPSLTSFSAGALIVQKPQELDANWGAFWLLDEKHDTGWASPENVVTPQTLVIALPERTQLDRLVFDTGGTDGEGRGAKDITAEMSDQSATSGFQPIGNVSLQDKADDQSFPLSAAVPGRWLRLTIANNHGSTQYTELFDVRGYGKQLAQTAFPNVSGTYATNYGNFHLKQEGTSVTGCYEYNGGLLTGGIEGRVMKFTWRETNNFGPAMMVFTGDGKQMFGLWWYNGQTEGRGSTWDGSRISTEVGSCPHWSGKTGAEERMTKELEDLGRTRVYGINFDTDSNVIKDESKPTLDKIVALLHAKPDWKLKIEGHTDSTGGDAHNQQLSQSRADAVKSYIVAAGIDTARLSAAGMGSSKPVAGNDSASGRAQNRRVELAKE
jgi:outer membrane protein OmpA-like peptidoglycan-associated protein